jgi:hypothetical protein
MFMSLFTSSQGEAKVEEAAEEPKEADEAPATAADEADTTKPSEESATAAAEPAAAAAAEATA